MIYTELSEMIYKRRSVRKYEKETPGAERVAAIERAIGELRPLYPDVRCELKLVCREDVRTIMRWFPKLAVAVYTEAKDGSLENAGFMLEQLDLYIQSIGLGSCWVGLGRVKNNAVIPEGLECVMLLAIGESGVPLRGGAADFKRRDISEITDAPSDKLEPARLAPSSVNSQPWYFAATDGGYDVYKKHLVRTSGLSRMNTIDVGIALAHLFVSNPERFLAKRREPAPSRDGMSYVTTVYLS